MKKQPSKTLSETNRKNGGSRFFSSPLVLLLFLLTAVFIVYIPALSVPPILDDNSAIINNSRVTNLANVDQIFADFFNNRGLVQLSLAMEWYYFSDAIPVMHFTNILLHLLVIVLVYFGIRSIWRFFYPHIEQSRDWKYYGLIAAVVFALHPVNTQPVTYVISRANILATLFFMTGVIIPLKLLPFTFNPKRPLFMKIGIYIVMIFTVLTSFALGLASKEIIVTLPAILLLCLMYSWRHKKWTKIIIRTLLLCIPFVILFAVYFLHRKATTGSYLYIPDSEVRSPLVNLYTQICIIILYYIPRILIPVDLLFRPPFELAHSMTDPRFIFSSIVIVFLVSVAVYLYRKKPEISLGILWFFITLSPTTSFLPLWDLIAERRLYLPTIGLGLAAESIFFYLINVKKREIKFMAAVHSILILIAFSTLTLMRNFEYQNPVRFWYKEHVYSPYNLENLHNYLFQLTQNGEHELVKKVLTDLDWNKIKEENEYIDTGSLDSLIRLMLHHQIEVEYATFLAEKNAEKYPTAFSYHTYQAGLIVQNRFKDAMDIIDKTLAIDPNHADTLYHQALIYRIFSQYENAEKSIGRALCLRPNDITFLEEQSALFKAMNRDTRQIEQKIKELRQQNRYHNELNLKSSL